MGDDEAKVKGIVEASFPGLDETIADYLVSVLSDDPRQAVRPHTYTCLPTYVDASIDQLSQPIHHHTPLNPHRPETWRRPWGPSS